MLVYIVRRLLWLPVLLASVTFVTFVLGRYGPGDPVQVRLGTKYTPEAAARLRREMGLDRPLLVQYLDYIRKAVRGDLGESYTYPGRSVSSLIGKRIWVSAQLGCAALLIGIILGIPLGLLAAYRQGTWLDTALVSGALFFYSMPVFITAPFLILVFAVRLDLLPTSGWQGFFSPHIVMPALVMGLPGVAGIGRLTRASALEVLGQDFVRTARAKGLPETLVQTRHVLRNALIPVVTVLGFSLAGLVEGAFITETIFGIPGIGRLAVESIFRRDYPIITALVMIFAVSFVLANLLVDILYAVLDPRIRYR
ncbi:MAG: ABC transporter permease [Dehalococcoidia bacterium]|nr:ABC transporter permease [Dehalococcoidia bacterium]MDW8120086.1 ABC transporter permease [Chloroflexota bacterium]